MNFKCARWRILSLLKSIYSLDQAWKFLDRPKAELWLEAFQHCHRRYKRDGHNSQKSKALLPVWTHLDFSASAVNSLELVKRSMKPDGASDTTPQADVPLLRKQWLCAWITIFHSALHLFKYFFWHVFIVQKFFLSAKRVIREINPCINFPFIYPLQLKSSGHHQFLRAHPGICISPLSPVDWYCCRLT